VPGSSLNPAYTPDLFSYAQSSLDDSAASIVDGHASRCASCGQPRFGDLAQRPQP